MVTKITTLLDNTPEFEAKVSRVFETLSLRTDFKIEELILCEDSICGEYEYVYIFGSALVVDVFINELLLNKVPVLSKEDFTDELINIINNDTISEFKYKLSHNDVLVVDNNIDNFYFKNITPDMILDKKNKFKVFDLTEIEKRIMEYYYN